VIICPLGYAAHAAELREACVERTRVDLGRHYFIERLPVRPEAGDFAAVASAGRFSSDTLGSIQAPSTVQAGAGAHIDHVVRQVPVER
jgi:hypothetical protein